MQSVLSKAMVLALSAGLFVPGCKKKEASPSELIKANTSEQKDVQPAKAAASAKVPKLTRAKKFASPQEVFDEGRAAILAKDFGRFVDCVSPESRKELAAGMVMMLGFMTDLGLIFEE